MGIKDIPGILGRAWLKKETGKPENAAKKSEETAKGESSQSTNDSITISDARIAIEKENILASKSIENFDHARSVLSDILNGIDEKNLLEIHGNADKIKTFLIM